MTVLVNGELVLYGFVGDNFWDMGFTAREVIDALAEVGRNTDVTVRINSGGGYTDDGVAIYNALTAHKGKITVIVDSVAFSSASLIAMAGDERIMRKGAMMMIHDPSGGVWGTAQEMESFTSYLQKQADSMASIYAEVTGEDPDDIREDMKTELWLTAEEAVERGFATSVSDTKIKAVAAHDYRVYAHAPERLVALATKKNWSHSETRSKAMASATADNRQHKEQTMTDKPKADDTSADLDQVKADAGRAAVAAFKTRRGNVMAFEETKGREALAETLIDTDLSEDAIKTALAAAPKGGQPDAGGKPQSSSYERQRVEAAGLAQPGDQQPTSQAEKRQPLKAAVDRLNNRR